jgi:shikimate 5-dehydrogenase
VLGAGGAARAVVMALHSCGADVRVSARRQSAAERLARSLGTGVASWPPPDDWDLLVNATPAGTAPDVDAAPLALGDARGRLVYDLVYNPEPTALMRQAAGAGADVIGGLEMLVAQAAAQFTWWTGRPASAALMAARARDFITRDVR